MNSDYFAQLGWLEKPPTNFNELVPMAVAASDGGELRRLATYGLSESQLSKLARAIDKTRKPGILRQGLTPLRLAILSNNTADHLRVPLVGTAARYGVDLEVFTLSYNEAYTAAVGEDDRLKKFAPNAVLIAFDHHGLPLREAYGRAEEERQIVGDCVNYLQAMISGVRKHYAATCIVQTIPSPLSSDFGHADRTIAGSVRRMIGEINSAIAKNNTVLDVAALAEIIGTSQWCDSRLFHIGKFPFSPVYVPLYAEHVCRVIGAMLGKSRRVLILDLDNTLWGGVVGDDGVEGIEIGNGSPVGEAFLEFQRKVLALRNRGVLLAVASKNDEEPARAPFREIPDMLLKEDAFTAFHANWDDKAANIKMIAEELSLGLDSFVFVDDNPAERALVRRFLPEVAVPEMPEDPAHFALALDAAGYFEAISFSPEDAKRADLYRARETMTRVAPHDLDEHLKSLHMKLIVEPINPANRARVVQLVNKSNQFNLTTQRFTDAEVQDLETDDRFEAFAMRLMDNLDDHGIISVIFGEQNGVTLDIFLWVMSCRVLGRRVEQAALGFLAERAKRRGCASIKGRYIPTPRNKLVEKHYANLGFEMEAEGEDGSTAWSVATTKVNAGSVPIKIIV